MRVEIDRRVKDEALGRGAIAAGATDLLVVTLHVARSGVMDHAPNIRLVDAHAESHRGDYLEGNGYGKGKA